MRGQRNALFSKAPVTPPPPISAVIAFNNFSTYHNNYDVFTSSGNLYAQGPSAVLVIVESGGTPPLSDTHNAVKLSGTGTVATVASGDGVHDTVAWAGLNTPGDVLTFEVPLNVTDSVGATGSATTGTVTLTRH